jgi:hypothetical protein
MPVLGSLERVFIVTCAVCGSEYRRWGTNQTKASTARAARAKGWSKSRDRGWLCPDHKRGQRAC